MTKDTTFKEFVEEKGINFASLVFRSDEYNELAKQFNEAKLEVIRAEADAMKCDEVEENEKESETS